MGTQWATNPSKIYKDKGWISMSDWLGTKKGWDGKYLDFEKAREIVRILSNHGSPLTTKYAH